MLHPDDLMRFVRDHAERGTMRELSVDKNSGESVIDSETMQINFDAYAKSFVQRHCNGASGDGFALPGSCDALDMIADGTTVRFVLTEYKCGNIISHNQGTNRRFINRSVCKDIEKKLYDSALMLLMEGLVTLDALRHGFIVLVVVPDRRLLGSAPAAGHILSPASNPVLGGMLIAEDMMAIKKHMMICELLYANVAVVSATVYQQIYARRFSALPA